MVCKKGFQVKYYTRTSKEKLAVRYLCVLRFASLDILDDFYELLLKVRF